MFPMFTVRVIAETSASPEQVLEAAHDFSARRAEVWPNVSGKTLEVHEIGGSFADVTEGLGSNRLIWERCRYDWSQRGSVTATVQDSNILRPGSSWELKATSIDDGARVESIFSREYKRSFGARLAEGLFRIAGKQLAGWDLRRALSEVEKGQKAT
jgi:hypothetical protein